MVALVLAGRESIEPERELAGVAGVGLGGSLGLGGSWRELAGVGTPIGVRAQLVLGHGVET